MSDKATLLRLLRELNDAPKVEDHKAIENRIANLFDAVREELGQENDRLAAENALLKAEPGQSLVLRCGELEAENARLWGDKYERSLVYEKQRALIGQLEAERDELQAWREKAINLYPDLERME